MMLKTAFVILALILPPLPALAQHHCDHSAASCAEGTHWDAEAGKCLPTVSS
jgi:hypothetical protein